MNLIKQMFIRKTINVGLIYKYLTEIIKLFQFQNLFKKYWSIIWILIRD